MYDVNVLQRIIVSDFKVRYIQVNTHFNISDFKMYVF